MAAQKQEKKQKLGNVRYVFKNIILPRKWLLLLGLLIIIVNRLAGLIIPGSSKFLIDNIITEGQYDKLTLLLLVVSGAVGYGGHCSVRGSGTATDRPGPGRPWLAGTRRNDVQLPDRRIGGRPDGSVERVTSRAEA